MEAQELLGYFRRGLIPGPDESEEDFVQRAQKSSPLSHLEWGLVGQKTVPLFGWSVDWMPISYSNHKLAWWEGAATWISDTPSIQLRKGFQKGSYLGYRLTDVLAHEAIHAARIKFKEPLFEEMLAYSVAPQQWKQFVGPLFSRSWEPLLLLLAFVAGGFSLWIPFLATALCLAWLGWRRFLFKRCCRVLPLSIVMCLTDGEIKRVHSCQELTSYLESRSGLRVELLTILLKKDM